MAKNGVFRLSHTNNYICNISMNYPENILKILDIYDIIYY